MRRPTAPAPAARSPTAPSPPSAPSVPPDAWARWAPHYAAICAEFGYDPADDRDAAHRLRALLAAAPADPLPALLRRLAGQSVAVVGCAPALDALPRAALGEGPVVACDGASARLRELGVVPDAVVTDLDGDPDALLWAAAQGATMVVHAHGDNRAALAALVPRLLGAGAPVVGTHQGAPEPGLAPLWNPGGFTDGDRAVLLCEAAGAAAARLVAFDFDAPPGRHSHRFDPATKPRKLRWAARLVDEAAARGRLRVVA